MIHISPDSAVSRLRLRHHNVRLRSPAGRRRGGDRLSAERRLAFLSALAQAGTLEEALRLTGVDRASVLELRARDMLFAKAWEQAQDQRVAQIEAMLLDKAIEGLSRTDVMAADKVAEAAMRYSTNLGMWLLEARMPHRYAKGTARGAAREPAGPTAKPAPPTRDPAADAARITELIEQAEKRLAEAEAVFAAESTDRGNTADT